MQILKRVIFNFLVVLNFKTPLILITLMFYSCGFDAFDANYTISSLDNTQDKKTQDYSTDKSTEKTDNNSSSSNATTFSFMLTQKEDSKEDQCKSITYLVCSSSSRNCVNAFYDKDDNPVSFCQDIVIEDLSKVTPSARKEIIQLSNTAYRAFPYALAVGGIDSTVKIARDINELINTKKLSLKLALDNLDNLHLNFDLEIQNDSYQTHRVFSSKTLKDLSNTFVQRENDYQNLLEAHKNKKVIKTDKVQAHFDLINTKEIDQKFYNEVIYQLEIAKHNKVLLLDDLAENKKTDKHLITHTKKYIKNLEIFLKKFKKSQNAFKLVDRRAQIGSLFDLYRNTMINNNTYIKNISSKPLNKGKESLQELVNSPSALKDNLKYLTHNRIAVSKHIDHMDKIYKAPSEISKNIDSLGRPVLSITSKMAYSGRNSLDRIMRFFGEFKIIEDKLLNGAVVAVVVAWTFAAVYLGSEKVLDFFKSKNYQNPDTKISLPLDQIKDKEKVKLLLAGLAASTNQFNYYNSDNLLYPSSISKYCLPSADGNSECYQLDANN